MIEFDMTTDVLIVGAGPAGLSAAISIKQGNPDIGITVLDKAAEAGGQLVSGSVIDPKPLDQLWPDWRDHVPHQNVIQDELYYLGKTKSLQLPNLLSDTDAVIVSINQLGRALSSRAENMDVDVLYGFAGQSTILNHDNEICGVVCGDGTRIGCGTLILAEGCFGNLSQETIVRYNLRGDRHQTYGLGIKEIWRLTDKQFRSGKVLHTIGKPLDYSIHGGGWAYHYGDNLVSLGLITALDYDNPTISPFDEMQEWKTNPLIADMLEGAKRISYQARCLVEGGLQSLPKLDFPGGYLIGDSAGFLNAGRIKGIHTSIASGMLVAKAIQGKLSLQSVFEDSDLYQELYKYRNIRPSFSAFGKIPAILHSGFQMLGGWRLPYTFPCPSDRDRDQYSTDAQPRFYKAPDNKLTFDKVSSLALSSIQAPTGASHLLIKDVTIHEERIQEPAPYYCPAGVYEMVNKEFIVNHENCIHCKACAIKDPDGNIVWTPPEGASGPSYENI